MSLKRKRVILLGTMLAAALAGGLGWMYFGRGSGFAPSDENPRVEWMSIDPGDPELVVAGRKLYEANCAQCHGYGLEGQPNWRERGADGILPAPPHDQTGHSWHHPDAILFAMVKLGGQAFMPAGMQSGMPAFAGAMTDGEIEATLAYIKSRWPYEIRRRQQLSNMQSRPSKE